MTPVAGTAAAAVRTSGPVRGARRECHTPAGCLRRGRPTLVAPATGSGSSGGEAAGSQPARDLAGDPQPQTASPPATAGQPSPAGLLLPPPPDLRGKNPRRSWNATALAFMGDAVWEMYARRKFFNPPTRMAAYYQSVVQSVRAEKQAEHYAALAGGSFLTPEERDVLRWGRNATGSTSPKRFAGADVSRDTYRAATAVECLVGYLYLTDPQRLHAVMEELGMNPAEAG